MIQVLDEDKGGHGAEEQIPQVIPVPLEKQLNTDLGRMDPALVLPH